jgi:anti-anti-sigma regulatory factor
MASEEGAVFIGKYASSFIFKGEGRLTQRSLGRVNAAVKQCAEDRGITELLVDISACHYMDSTILGIVARWAIAFTQDHAMRPFLLGLPGSPLEHLFKRMNLNTLFHVSPDARLTSSHALVQVTLAEHVSDQDYAAYVLSAHETLATLSADNATEFAAVIQCLKTEVQQT